jgi:spore coat polysaccharide biosynthesis predicted glycosyltransferase SpsG
LKRLREVLDASGVDAPRLLAIDDECHRRLGAASLALNTRPGLARTPYAAGVRALLGESYALLRPGLRSPEAIDPPWPDDIDPVLVMIGGTDPRGLAAAALHALADVDAQRYAPVLVQTRAADDGGAAIEAALARFEARVWVSRVDACALAGWARVCRWSISACGSTIYELSFLGLPFVGIIAAENQRAFAREIENRWAMPVVEGDERLRASAAGAFRRLVAQPIQESWRAIDGLGARRVADAMEREDHASSLVAEPVSG